MINKCLFPVILLPAILSGCDDAPASGALRKMQKIVDHKTTPFITVDSVWRGDMSHCFYEKRHGECLINTIQNSGSPKAVEAAMYVSAKEDYGYVSGYTRIHNIAIATVTYPFREKNTQEDILVPSEGAPVDMQDALQGLEGNGQWRRFLQKQPHAFPVGPGFLVDKSVNYHGQQLFYAYPVKVCEDCETIGILTMSYNFDRSGDFTGNEVVGVVN